MTHNSSSNQKQAVQTINEFGRESLPQAMCIAKALYLILHENNCISHEKAHALFEEYNSNVSSSGTKAGISVVCNSCSRSIVYKPAQQNRCMYCGKIVTLSESFDATDLFRFNYMQFISLEYGNAPRSSSSDPSELEQRMARRMHTSRQVNAVNITSKAIASYMMADAQGSTKTSADIDYEIGVSRTQAVQRSIDHFLNGLKSMWIALSNDDKTMNERLSQKYGELYNAKKEATGDSVLCPHCNEKNAPFRLLSIPCIQCGKDIALPLREGFMTSVFDEKENKFVPRHRLIDNIFTLLEAIVIISQDICPEVTYSSVSARAHQLFIDNDTEKESLECPSCLRPIKIAGAKQKCIYCNAPLASTEPGYFFNALI